MRLVNATLLDPESGALLPDRHVICEDGRIVDVAEGRAPGGDDVIDAGGAVVMPGLVDCHVHVAITTMDFASLANRPEMVRAQEVRLILEAMLARGFTTVRDCGGADFGVAAAVDRGLVRGPRVLYSGRALSQTGGHGDVRPISHQEPRLCACEIHSSWFSHVADGVDAVRKAAREELRLGAHQLKFMASGGVASPTDPLLSLQYSPEEMRAIVEEAEARGTYAMAHAYSPEAIRRAVEAGVRSIEHGNLMDEATARLLAERGTFLVPTLVTYEAIAKLGRQLGFPEVSQRKVDDVLGAGLTSLELARAHGILMAFGTDLLGETHDQQLGEFALRAQALPAIDVIRSATTVAAKLLRRSGEIGVVAPGARADLLLLDGNPLDDPSVLAGRGERIRLVLKDGRVAVDRR